MSIFDNKKEFALKYLNSLIKCQEYRPFLHFDDLSFGLFDAQFITKSKGLSLLALKEDVRTRKSFSCDWFTTQVRKIFIQISDYVLLNDPLQEICRKGLQSVQDFEKQYAINFRKKRTDEKKSHAKKTLNFVSQMEMAFYLKNSDHDEELMRKIGELCQIVQEDDCEYIFDLGASNIWGNIIDKFKDDSISR